MKFLAVVGGKLDDYVIDHFLINSKKNKYIFYNMYGQTEASPELVFLVLKIKPINLFCW